MNAAPERELVALVSAAFPLEPVVSPPMTLDAARWSDIVTASQRHGLTGLLWRAIETLGRADVPSAAAELLQDTYRRSALSQALAYRELESLMGECARASIPLLVLKGAALARTLYSEPPLRPFGDLDVLIPQGEAHHLREMLIARGLRQVEMALGFNLDYYGEMAFFATRASDLMIDLHWELAAPGYYRRRMDVGWFWENTEEFVVGAQRARRLNPTAQLMHLALHAGLHHQDNLRLIWLYDIALLVTRRGKDIHWQAADEYARRTSLARPLRAMLDAAHSQWGVTLPQEAMTRFHPSPWAWRERAVYAVTTARHPEARALSDAMSAPGMGQKLELVREQLFPTAAYMREHYGVTNDALLPFYYARRVLESAGKFTRSLWSAANRG
jgi:hypothetical protein